MKVKIIKCIYTYAWYKSEIGKEFEVIKIGRDKYQDVVTKGFIDKDDCQIIEK